MVEAPIIFSGPMVRALLEGRKTQTRRVGKVRKGVRLEDLDWDGPPGTIRMGRVRQEHIATRFSVGDRLWVKETWAEGCEIDDRGNPWPIYAARYGERSDPCYQCLKPWRSSMFMPRKYSRLTLTVTDVRVQRLQEISDHGASNDCTAEGVFHCGMKVPSYEEWSASGLRSSEKFMYRQLWDSLNAKRGYGWDVNPWVVALTFTVEQRNFEATSSPEAKP